MNENEILAIAAKAAPSWTTEVEQVEMIHLARQVNAGGLIVEIGGLYGGMTVILGLANPQARIVVVDDFSWHPIKGLKASPALLLSNCKGAGVTNVRVITGDSRIVGADWNESIDLLWIDGGHSYEFVRSDLDKFGPWTKRIALHDWDNPIWGSIRQAVEDYLRVQPEWRFDHNTEMIAVLERMPPHEPQMSEM